MSQCFVLGCVLGTEEQAAFFFLFFFLQNSNYETRKLITKTEHCNSNDDDEHI